MKDLMSARSSYFTKPQVELRELSESCRIKNESFKWINKFCPCTSKFVTGDQRFGQILPDHAKAF